MTIWKKTGVISPKIWMNSEATRTLISGRL